MELIKKTIVDIKGAQNKEIQIAQRLKSLRGNCIVDIKLNDTGNLEISYEQSERYFVGHYSVKQVSKKKYKSLNDFYNQESFKGQCGHSFIGGPKLVERWVIDLRDVWLVFFKTGV